MKINHGLLFTNLKDYFHAKSEFDNTKDKDHVVNSMCLLKPKLKKKHENSKIINHRC